MATSIVMPSLGMYTSEGTLANWLKLDGDHLDEGEPVLEIETEKALHEIVAPASGVLQCIAQAGAQVSEQGLLGYVLVGDEGPMPVEPPADQTIIENPSNSAASQAAARGGFIKASPLARKLAVKHGIDLQDVQASGSSGRISEADVRAHIDTSRSGIISNAEAFGTANLPTQGTPMSAMRLAISRRLRQGLENAVSLTLTREVEAAPLVDARQHVRTEQGTALSYDAFFVKLLALALRDCPTLNVVVANERLFESERIDVCVAIGLSDGLVAPVIRDADRKPIALIASEIFSLKEKALLGRLEARDTEGGSTTITNLGAHGVDSFTPVLNTPQSSILGIGRICDRPIARNKTLAIAPTCWLSLTFDHRVTDGTQAAAVLEAIASRMLDTDTLFSLATQNGDAE